MPHFRHWPDSIPQRSWPGAETVRDCVSDSIRCDNFFIDDSLQLAFAPAADEEIFWEMFQGRALDRSQTRQRRRFLAWNMWDRDNGSPSDEPLLSVKWDRDVGLVHITRSILYRAWEGYSDETGAILSRETVKRIRELVGTIDLAGMATAFAFQDELVAVLFHAVIGMSRLPITSDESPLPEFVLGQLAYCYRFDAKHNDSPAAFLDDGLRPELASIEKTKLLEWVFRRPTEWEADQLAIQFADRWRKIGETGESLMDLLRELFNDVSLSPYLGLVAAVCRNLAAWVDREIITRASEVDFLTHLLRQIGRHLTAFDLIRFHHRGANYPDALLIDEVLFRVAELTVLFPRLFLPQSDDDAATERTKRLRRRGVRQAMLMRKIYRGHAVPDSPTSPGENARVWPSEVARVPEEQIQNVKKRTRQLFEADLPILDADIMHIVFQASLEDLNAEIELRELGTALFLDRPFGIAKRPTETDRTLLFSSITFSRRIATDRLRLLESGDRLRTLGTWMQSAEFNCGIGYTPKRPMQRPGSASQDDALQVADDVVFLRTTRRSVVEFLRWYDVTPLEVMGLGEVFTPGSCLFLRSDSQPEEIVVYDDGGKPRLAMRPDLSRGYVHRIGVEHPAGGLQIVRVWAKGQECDCSAADIRLQMKG